MFFYTPRVTRTFLMVTNRSEFVVATWLVFVPLAHISLDLSIRSNTAMSLEYVPVGSKSSKFHQEEVAAVATDMSVEFIPYSSKASKPAGKTSKAPVEAEEPLVDDTPAPKAKSSESIPITPRSISLGETDTQVAEANSEVNGADDARKMSAVSVAVVGAMLFL
jgi:hypothetical protein